MKSSDIRQSFLSFFEERGHRIVPSSPVIPHGDPTLLFTNAGMNQFKDVFLGTGKREYVRAADTQKCIRVSGKHNDLEEVGRDTYHHTFFEMLGNWSFGDYYKKEAIGWAWELLTEVWGLEKRRLYATVYETDEEAERYWKSETDIDPTHIQRFGKKDNFWEMGETGPCGPCSEVHIDLTADLQGAPLVNAGDPRVMEIWNLVFIQNNRNDRGELELLPATHVDTGMGFERVCAVLQGKHSNYDTDVFTPIIEAIATATGRPYEAEADRVAMRVIADHIRMLSFAIADGALPGNDGRGYVLRRILRRAARFGRNLGMREPFIYGIADAVATSMGQVFPEIVQRTDHIKKVIRAEEESFSATLDRGIEIFEGVLERIGHSTVFPGADAFRLYDTFGFPLDLTQLMAGERGLKVDADGFTELMEEQRTRAREAGRIEVAAGDTHILAKVDGLPPSTFVGYTSIDTEAIVEQVVDDKFVVLDRTPFYVEAGGQVDDIGIIESEDFAAEVLDSFKRGGTIVHEVRVTRGRIEEMKGKPVRAHVNRQRRLSIQRNHSATHLVHEALRRILGAHVHQQGSLVAPDHLRFDFPHFGKIAPSEIRAIEDLVNAKIAEQIPVHTGVDLPIARAQKIPNVKMFFGDKYGDIVRVVTMDEKFSVEFCGGTHVRNTGDIGHFKIISESSIASGVRRIEAVTGEGVQRYIDRQIEKAHELDGRIERLLEEREALRTQTSRRPDQRAGEEVKAPEDIHFPSRISPTDGLETVETGLLDRNAVIEEITRQSSELRKEISRVTVDAAAASLDALIAAATQVGAFRVVAARIQATDMDDLKRVGDSLREKIGSGVGVLGTVVDNKVALVCIVSDDLIQRQKLQAGTIVGKVAKIVGGGGGGRPHLATAGGKDPARLDEALAQVTNIIQEMV
jgi:alanyl-tRNA synthetase